jgi:hypothetical protein
VAVEGVVEVKDAIENVVEVESGEAVEVAGAAELTT